MSVSHEQNQIDPCGRCSKKRHCAPYSRLLRTSSAWATDEIQRDYRFLCIAWADSDENGKLTVRVECSEYDEDVDA